MRLNSSPIYSLLLLIAALVPLGAQSQNLVPDPGFEHPYECPTFPNYLPFNNWRTSPDSGADYYNPCATYEWCLPANQAPHSGDSYAGIVFVGLGSNYREYVSVELTEPLVAGETYYFSCFLSRGERSAFCYQELGMLLTVDEVTGFNWPETTQEPQIKMPEGQFLCDSVNWLEMAGEYTASGGEKWLLISQFETDDESARLRVRNDSEDACYYIDDVWLATEKPPYVSAPTTINAANVFTPNGDGVNDEWTIDQIPGGTVVLLNRWGSVVKTASLDQKFSWTGEGLSDGVYFYKIVGNETVISGNVQLLR